MNNKNLRIGAIGDLHFTESSKGILTPFLNEISRKADILLVCGDLTNKGLPEQALVMAEEFRVVTIPVLAVLGNHDYENNKQEEIKKILNDSNIKILDGDFFVYRDVGFAGVKGFMGGFDNHILASWGEKMIKNFVFEAVNESIKLENALSKLETKNKVVLLHYAPIRKTVEGEHPEIIPFCGSSRLAEPIDEFNADLVFHSHAHHGHVKGHTAQGVPVYNVSYFLLNRLHPTKPYVIVEI